MKKTYIIPEALVVTLSSCSIIAESLQTYGESSDPQAMTGDVLTKEDVSTGGSSNVWDEEW